MAPNETTLRQIKGNELRPGAIFYVKSDNGEFHRAECEPDLHHNRGTLAQYRQWIIKLSGEGRLYTRRDKAFYDFRDVLDS